MTRLLIYGSLAGDKSLTQDTNRYTYVRNTPSIAIDPTGLSFISFFKNVIDLISTPVDEITENNLAQSKALNQGGDVIKYSESLQTSQELQTKKTDVLKSWAYRTGQSILDTIMPLSAPSPCDFLGEISQMGAEKTIDAAQKDGINKNSSFYGEGKKAISQFFGFAIKYVCNSRVSN